jgi:5,10-methylenetetrahydromethanopterin reductase
LAGLPRPIVDRVRAAYRGGEFQEAAAAARVLPDEFVRKVALAGNRQHATGQIRAALKAGADSVHVFPLGTGRIETIRSFARAWADAVSSDLQPHGEISDM